MKKIKNNLSPNIKKIMAIDYDAILIFGAVIPEFGTRILFNIKKIDPEFYYEKDENICECLRIVNAWLQEKNYSFCIEAPGPYYDCPPENRTCFLTYQIKDDMDINEIRDFFNKVEVKEFQKIYEILVGDDENIVIPKLQALPNIW